VPRSLPVEPSPLRRLLYYFQRLDACSILAAALQPVRFVSVSPALIRGFMQMQHRGTRRGCRFVVRSFDSSRRPGFPPRIDLILVVRAKFSLL
jgi:hypothetical protein